MSTRSSIWLGKSKGKCVHVYWELADREVENDRMIGAPIYIAVDAGKIDEEVAIRLPKDIAIRLLMMLSPQRNQDRKLQGNAHRGYHSRMNSVRIIKSDADHPGPKVFLGIGRGPGDGYYTLKTESAEAFIAQVDGFFHGSVHLDGVKRSIREAARLNGGEVSLSGKPEMWIEFIRQNRERMGKHSRSLAA